MIFSKFPPQKHGAKLNYILPKNPNLDCLTPLERQVIEMRWGMPPYTKRYTFKEIAAIIEVSNHEYIQKAERSARVKLRKNPTKEVTDDRQQETDSGRDQGQT